MLSIFISGLKKGCGKTLVASGFAGTMQSLSYATSYYKPIQTGASFLNNKPQFDDVYKMQKIDRNIKGNSTYAFYSSLSPLAGVYDIGMKKIELNKIYDGYKINTQMTECHIVEGSNSISTPIDEKICEIHMAKTLGIPLLLVVSPKQTNIDEVITGINYVYSNQVQFLGVIVNDWDENSMNTEERYFPYLIKEFTGANILGSYPHYDNFEQTGAEIIIADTLNRINIENIFGVKIAKLGA